MQEVEIIARSTDLLMTQLTAEQVGAFVDAGHRAREAFGDRTIWHVNATSRGGGVAEMLQTLLAYGLAAGIENRWLVLDGDPEFFAITKRLHNFLHGDPGDGGSLGDPERAHYERVLAANVVELRARVGDRDIVVLHDPQAAGMVDGVRASGIRVVWRSHIGRDSANELTGLGWAFLRPYIEHADAYVFTRQEYPPDWLDRERLMVIPPSIDPFSAKNCEIDAPTVRVVLSTVGLLDGTAPDGPISFLRRDGTTGTVRRRAGLLAHGPPPPADAPIVLQVSRWDRLKDMAGVLEAFATMTVDGPEDAHLVLAGPDVAAVDDDPEGSAVYAECRARWSLLPEAIRSRIHLVSIPLDDVDENAIIVNALQRHAHQVVQKSLVEGFGLTVTEAMWKARPIIASRVGGIQDQIVHDRDGLLIEPHDVEGLAATMTLMLEDQRLADRLGTAARNRVRDHFLADRHLEQYGDLFARLSA